jgi:hypothetical protein
MYDDWQPPRQTAFTHGLGGESGVQNGRLMISARDRSRAESQYFANKADQDEQALRNGDRQDYIQVKNARDLANTKANEAANGGRTESMFTRPQSEANWAELNGGANDGGVAKYLDPRMQKYNTGEKWGGFQGGAAPIEEEGGGGGGGGGVRESSYTTNNGQTELIANRPGGQLQRFNQDAMGGLHSGGMVNGQYSAFSGDAYRDDKSASGSRFNQQPTTGYANMPIPQQDNGIREYGSFKNFQNVGTPQGFGSGMADTDNLPSPYQMVRNDHSGPNFPDGGNQFQSMTDEQYDPDYRDPNGGTWGQDLTAPDGKPVHLAGGMDAQPDWSNGYPFPEAQQQEAKKHEVDEDGLINPASLKHPDELSGVKESTPTEYTGPVDTRGFPTAQAAEEAGYKYSPKTGKFEKTPELIPIGKSKSAMSKIGDAAMGMLGNTESGRLVKMAGQKAADFAGGMMHRGEKAPGPLDSGSARGLEQFMMQHPQGGALPEMSPMSALPGDNQIAMDGGGRRDFNEDFNSTRTHDRATGSMEAGRIEAEMSGTKRSPRMEKDTKVKQRPMTHPDLVAMYLQHALGGMG